LSILTRLLGSRRIAPEPIAQPASESPQTPHTGFSGGGSVLEEAAAATPATPVARRKLPIIYVRGFAGSNVDAAVDDPFYGFNEGAVHVRVDGSGEPRFHQFESPLVRLLVEEGYKLYVHGGQRGFLERQEDGKLEQGSVWVHRFYDDAASTLGRRPQEYVLERAADDLFVLLKMVLVKTGAPRVHLVAHSMGGLICRSMIQRTIPDDPQAGGTLNAAERYVESLFTYGTPHGGIEFDVGHGLLERLRDLTGVQGADIFGPERMYEYLTPRIAGPQSRSTFKPEVMPKGGFPPEKVFCLVGTNPQDYTVALGLSSRAVGAASDGLVHIDNAYVADAQRAFVHRSHSGRYGLVNSEEGYQNLQRFLFGDLSVRVDLADLDVAGDRGDDIVWQLETSLAIRGLPVLVHEQTTAHHCPVQVEWRRIRDTPQTPVPLLTTFLSSHVPRPLDPETKRETPTLRHALKLRLISLREHDHVIDFFDHLEQIEDWADVLVVDIAPARAAGALPQVWAVWNSDLPEAIRAWNPATSTPLTDEEPNAAHWRGSVPLPRGAHLLLGEHSRLQLTVVPRR
jgi:pimeloyl-ACP methyl ester carboxylesterase